MKISTIFFFLTVSVNCKSTKEIFFNFCKHEIKDFRTSRDIWKYKMYDASTKISPGILSLNTSDFGNYEECIQIITNTSVGLIRGKYCLYNIKIIDTYNRSSYLRNALCIPDKCQLPLENNEVLFDENSCQTNTTFTEWTPYDLLVLLYFLILFVMVVVGTIYDIKTKTLENQNRILVSFSLRLNISTLIWINTKSDQIGCFNGIRLFCTLWILFGHSKEATHLVSLKNVNEVNELSASSVMAIWLAGHWTLQTFFFMSSFLISYSNFCKRPLTFKKLPTFYTQRILRFMPSLYSLLVLFLTILKKFSSGPDWPYTFIYLNGACKKYWWSYLLFIQNYINYNWKCVSQTWYINAELHMFILSPIILLPLNYWKTKNNRLAYIFILTAAVLSVLIPTAYDFTYNYANIFASHKHFFSFIMGILMGMFMSDQKTRIINITKIQKRIAWSFLIISMVVLSYYLPGQIHSEDFYINPKPYFVISYFISNIFTSWLVFNCLNEKEGFLNRFLSWKYFQPIARLTFSMYLVHLPIFYIYFARSRTPLTFSYIFLFYSFCENLILTILVSIVWMLIIEMPFSNLQKIFLDRRNK